MRNRAILYLKYFYYYCLMAVRLTSKEEVQSLLNSMIGKPFDSEKMTYAYELYNEIFSRNFESYGMAKRPEKLALNLVPCECHSYVLELLAAFCKYKFDSHE